MSEHIFISFRSIGSAQLKYSSAYTYTRIYTSKANEPTHMYTHLPTLQILSKSHTHTHMYAPHAGLTFDFLTSYTIYTYGSSNALSFIHSFISTV